MKKLLVVFLLFAVLATAVYGQERPHVPLSQYADGMTGHDWRMMSISQQTSLIQGMFLAYSGLWDSFVYTMTDGRGYDALDDASIAQLEDVFYVSVSIPIIIQRIDNYYAESSRRTHLLKDTLLWAADKEYW